RLDHQGCEAHAGGRRREPEDQGVTGRYRPSPQSSRRWSVIGTKARRGEARMLVGIDRTVRPPDTRRGSVRAAPWTFAAGLLLAGCVMQSTYNTMLQQQQAIEASLHSEISADQVKIEQLENGIRVRMSSDLLFHEGGVEISPKGRAAL